jgi:hypothetical protein
MIEEGNMKARIMVLKCWVIIGLLVFFWGCSVTLPNIRPFAAQTRRMVSAVDNGYTHAETLLSMVEKPGEPSEGQSSEKQKELSEKAEALWQSAGSGKGALKKLRNNWKLMKKVLNAFVIYSDELAALADVGTKGKKAAHGVANALNGIIGTMTNGALNIPGNLVNAFGKIKSTLEKLGARNDLKKAVIEAQPAINTIIKIIARNLDELELINKMAGRTLKTYYFNTNQRMLNYYDALIEEQQPIFEILTTIIRIKRERSWSDSKSDREYLLKLDPVLKVIGVENITIKDIDPREKYWLKQLQKFNGEIKYLTPRYQAYKAREERINRLTITGSLIIRKGKKAIQAFGKAHMKLKKTLGKKQRMSLVEYASAVQDVVDAYKGGK